MRSTDRPESRTRAGAATSGALEPLGRYRAVRRATEGLTRSLTPEDMGAQSMPDASPTKWHLAHTTWFFETFMLAPHLPGYRVFDPKFGYLFNSYYEAVGPRQPRPARGLITRPSIADVLAYRAHVDTGMAALLTGGGAEGLADLLDLGLAHEEQHQELILMDILHLFAQSPLSPAFAPPRAAPGGPAPPLGYVGFQGGLVEVGHDGQGFAFDNEGPRHRVWLEPYRLADRLVTNGEWLAFMADGGYSRPEFWLSDGWALVRAEDWKAPIYWRETPDGWRVMGLTGLRPLDPAQPVSHLSYYEADAYASWAGARLPTEAEWEHAAASSLTDGNFVNSGRFDALAAVEGPGLRQMFGDLWEWTRSAYLPYPGFKAAGGAVGEYNGKFMSGQFVLRGGACVTPAGHARASYRNFFYPHQRWMFSGLRLALDGAGEGARATSDLEADVVAGLSRAEKTVPPKHFYDAAGSDLFEQITELPEYYPTRTEVALLRDAAAEISRHIPAGAALVEFGSGASTKTRIVLDAAPQVAVYAPIDISASALDGAARAIRADYPNLVVAPLRDDFTNALRLPEETEGRPIVGFFPGSTIGNFTPDEARAFLVAARRLLGEGAAFLIGADLVKDPATLVAAYDDAQGVTAAFNKNLLARINRELNGDFDLDAFAHRAVWNAAESRIEMHLVSLKDQVAHAAGHAFRFAEGETIHTENSYKFTIERISTLAAESGWKLEQRWVSEDPAFGMVLLRS
ncbi:ergothioneine biosynthesis protein EgtB [Phenylobacterium sp.]|uniref:ergothioneine biosynthesis protein EgtB n=1 Tax=Phenylobacterium sp. TaxID=1871053 RepID=UPI0025D70671|nr:ergothioneine biosynthesis protein EgtB [Phenylobacterium sp.]